MDVSDLTQMMPKRFTYTTILGSGSSAIAAQGPGPCSDDRPKLNRAMFGRSIEIESAIGMNLMLIESL
jgi:hypothetical protein